MESKIKINLRIPEIGKYFKTVDPARSVLLLGPPGIGKSVVVREFAESEARELGLEFIDYDDRHFDEVMQAPDKYYVFVDLRLTEVEPTDLIGFPRDFNGYVAYKPLTFAVVLSRVSHGLLFLDELTNVTRPDVKAAAYKIILDRKIGFTKLSPGVRVIAAGNTPEHSAIAERLPAPLTSRFHVVSVEAPALDEWALWMDRNYPGAWDKRVLAYLMKFKDDFIAPPRDPETLENYPTPRTWTWLARELPNTPGEFIRPKVIGYLGLQAGSRFIAFLENPVPEPQDLLANPDKFIDLKLDGKYLAVIVVASYFDENKKVGVVEALKFTDVISMEQHEFAVLFLMGLRKRRREFYNAVVRLQNSPTWEALKEVASYLVMCS